MVTKLLKKKQDRTFFKHYFGYQSLAAMLKHLIDTDGKINTDLADSIQNKLSNLMENFLSIYEEEAKSNRLDKTLKIVGEILKFNKKYQKQEGHRLKILTPEQMLSRLPISLIQLKAGNNSEKLKNEIRQLLYSLYRSKKLSKTIYKHLMNTII